MFRTVDLFLFRGKYEYDEEILITSKDCSLALHFHFSELLKIISR